MFVQVVIGFIVLSVVIRVLKLEVKQPRPENGTMCPGYTWNHGWPSGHTALIAYFATVTGYWCLTRNSAPRAVCLFAAGLCAVAVFAMAKSRILDKCHTVNQTKYGAMFGFVIGMLTVSTFRDS
jgi:membrane-associated phospholipid phosphatase